MSDREGFPGQQAVNELLWGAMRGSGGVTNVLLLLRNLAREMAHDQREIVQNEWKAAAWENVAEALNEAAEQSVPLSETQ
jgi:hypothetical protein